MAETVHASPELVERMGVKIPIDRSVMSDAMVRTLREGDYEGPEARNLARIVEQNERVLELGGGVGFLSALIGRLDLAASIVTVEANPALVPLIGATHRLNGVKAEVIYAAVVGEKTSETLPFSIAEDFWASSLTPRKPSQVQAVVQTPVLALGDLVARYRPTMLIVDVEGSEVELLSRPHDLDGVKKVLIEIHDKVIGPEGVKRLFDIFSAAGFYVDLRRTASAVVLFRRLG